MLEATRAELARLPDVSGEVAGCLDAQRALYAEAMGDVETLRLQFRLGLLTGSTPPSAEQGHAFMRAQIEILQRDKE